MPTSGVNPNGTLRRPLVSNLWLIEASCARCGHHSQVWHVSSYASYSPLASPQQLRFASLGLSLAPPPPWIISVAKVYAPSGCNIMGANIRVFAEILHSLRIPGPFQCGLRDHGPCSVPKRRKQITIFSPTVCLL